ncbi:hypothetical protein OROGR_014676 [Orobanche gracilis]
MKTCGLAGYEFFFSLLRQPYSPLNYKFSSPRAVVRRVSPCQCCLPPPPRYSEDTFNVFLRSSRG